MALHACQSAIFKACAAVIELAISRPHSAQATLALMYSNLNYSGMVSTGYFTDGGLFLGGGHNGEPNYFDNLRDDGISTSVQSLGNPIAASAKFGWV